MNTIEPNETNIRDSAALDQELSVEEMAEIDALETIEEDTNAASNEPTEAAVSAEAAVSPVPITPRPIRPVLATRRVSGRYANCPRPWKLELRVDVDGYRPMKRVSGDYYIISGATTSYYGSFVVDAPSISISSTQVTITGIAKTTWATSYNKLRIIIPRHTIFQPSANAYVQWMTTSNRRGAAYTCVYESPYFRTVDLEQDYEKGVTPFVSYNTGLLPSGGPARTLSVARSYAEAGVEMRSASIRNEVPVAAGSTWSNAELHAAMENHFSLWKDEPQWKVWLFHAMRHDYGPGLRGIMFDQKNKQRQGCASFYQRIAGTAPEKLRDQLYVGVHELGHCFNLFHSFHKKFMNPPLPNRPSAKSWMNYPQNYPGGAAAFWSAFPFQFDNLEVIHLRHAFRNNIIMGGNPFGTGAALENPDAFADNVDDHSGLGLELRSQNTSVPLGEPVVIEIKLYTTDLRGKRVHKDLHPDFGFVQIAIQQPGGEVVLYHPPIDHCIEVETTLLDAATPAVYDSAYIGYDKERGQIFNQPGQYQLRGVYYALDGSVVLSELITLKVRAPMTEADVDVADLFLGNEQGMLLYLLGSDSDVLQSGNDAFDQVLDKYADHPLAVYARLVKGTNAGRDFKTIAADYQVESRKAQADEAEKQLSAVIDASQAEAGVDNITLNETMRRLARVQGAAGKKKEATATMKKMITVFKKKSLKAGVLDLIEKQAAEVTAKL